MRCNKILCLGIMVVLALFLGCNKGKTAAAKKAEMNKALASTADTADIFKEFYSEDTAKKGPVKKTFGKSAKNETFSPALAASSQAEFSANGRYVVQVSCVKSQRFAEKMAGGLKEKGYPAYVSEVQNPTPNLSGAYYRIRIGGFNAFSAAKAFGENTLSPGGYQYWIDKKSNDKVGMEGYGLGAGSAIGGAAGSYEGTAPASSSWTSPPASSSASQPSSAPIQSSNTPASSSPSAAAPDAPAQAQTSAAANPGFGSQSPSAAPSNPSSTPQASSNAPAAATQSSSAPSPATQPSSAPSPATQPSGAPSSSTSGGSKSSTAGSGSDWGADSSASGSGW
jgi:SPOR domain